MADYFVAMNCKYLIKRKFLKERNTQNLQNFVKTTINFLLLSNNHYQNINTDGNPNLHLHSIL